MKGVSQTSILIFLHRNSFFFFLLFFDSFLTFYRICLEFLKHFLIETTHEMRALPVMLCYFFVTTFENCPFCVFLAFSLSSPLSFLASFLTIDRGWAAAIQKKIHKKNKLLTDIESGRMREAEGRGEGETPNRAWAIVWLENVDILKPASWNELSFFFIFQNHMMKKYRRK